MMKFVIRIFYVFRVVVVLLIFSLMLPCISFAQTQNSPLAPILKTKIFVQKDEVAEEEITFNVPESGEAILRVVNGAKIDIDPSKHIQDAKITLNGKAIAIGRWLFLKRLFKRETNILEFQVLLRQGVNRLEVKLPAKRPKEPQKRLSVRIDAPADKIIITPIQNSLVVGRDSLKAQATVTGLGVPVPNADVTFAIQGLGLPIERTSFTDKKGVATALMMPELPLGNGLVGPQGIDNEIPPGEYIVTIRATSLGTKTSFKAEFPVAVIKPKASPTLVLGKPTAYPAGIHLRTKRADAPALAAGPSASTRIPPRTEMVTFHVLVAGTPFPPQFLYLDEVDAQGKALSDKDLGVAMLFNNGKGKDAKGQDKRAKDFAYTGTLTIPYDVEAEKYFRARAVYFGKTVLSDILTFAITRFPLKARPSDSKKLVHDDPKDNSPFYSNEIILKVAPGILPDNVVKISANVDGEVVGFIPPLRTYLLQIKGNGKASGVRRTIDVLSGLKGVERASPNNAVIPSGFPHEPPNDPEFCHGPPDINCQWYLQKIHAPEAWELAGGGDESHSVAVLDNGVKCDHNDLSGKCVGDDTANHDHGTGVAGIIAAIADNIIDITGMAYDTKVYPYLADNVYDMDENVFNDGLDPHVKIINISNVVGDDDGSILDLVCEAISRNRLVVAGAGNPAPGGGVNCNYSDYYPPKYNDPEESCPNGAALQHGLLVVGATDEDDKLAQWNQDGNAKCSNMAHVDLYAPGKEIVSISLTDPKPFNGTSFATPMVSAAAAMLWSKNPDWTPTQVHDRLISHAHELTSAPAPTPPDPFPLDGKPRLDIKAAFGSPPTGLNIDPLNPSIVETCSDNSIVATVSAIDPDAEETFTYSFVDDSELPTQGIGPFGIDRDTGNITVSGCPLDASTNPVYNVKTRVTDSAGLTYDEIFAIGVRAETIYDIDFETPDLGASSEQPIDPYIANSRVSFTIEDNYGFPDAMVGLVKNNVTSVCVDSEDDENQKLGTGRTSLSPPNIGFSAMPIKVVFNPPLAPADGTSSTVRVQFQALTGSAVRLRLFDSSDTQVAIATDTISTANGTCGNPGGPRGRSEITASTSAESAYAIIDISTNTPQGGRVFVIDNVHIEESIR